MAHVQDKINEFEESLPKKAIKKMSENKNESIQSTTKAKYVKLKGKGKSGKIKSSVKLSKIRAEAMRVKSYKSEPLKIIKIKVDSSANLSLLVKWSDGSSSSEPYSAFRQKYPQELISFFESKLVFPFENEGTRRFLLSNAYPLK